MADLSIQGSQDQGGMRDVRGLQVHSLFRVWQEAGLDPESSVGFLLEVVKHGDMTRLELGKTPSGHTVCL